MQKSSIVRPYGDLIFCFLRILHTDYQNYSTTLGSYFSTISPETPRDGPLHWFSNTEYLALKIYVLTQSRNISKYLCLYIVYRYVCVTTIIKKQGCKPNRESGKGDWMGVKGRQEGGK